MRVRPRTQPQEESGPDEWRLLNVCDRWELLFYHDPAELRVSTTQQLLYWNRVNIEQYWWKRLSVIWNPLKDWISVVSEAVKWFKYIYDVSSHSSSVKWWTSTQWFSYFKRGWTNMDLHPDVVWVWRSGSYRRIKNFIKLLFSFYLIYEVNSKHLSEATSSSKCCYLNIIWSLHSVNLWTQTELVWRVKYQKNISDGDGITRSQTLRRDLTVIP